MGTHKAHPRFPTYSLFRNNIFSVTGQTTSTPGSSELPGELKMKISNFSAQATRAPPWSGPCPPHQPHLTMPLIPATRAFALFLWGRKPQMSSLFLPPGLLSSRGPSSECALTTENSVWLLLPVPVGAFKSCLPWLTRADATLPLPSLYHILLSSRHVSRSEVILFTYSLAYYLPPHP